LVALIAGSDGIPRLVASSLALALIIAVGLSTNCRAASSRVVRHEEGVASWYGLREAGRKTASGVTFDPALPTAAHRRLPLGTCVRVTRLTNGKSIVVPIIDRGPFVQGRLIDLSEAAAIALDMIGAGLARVRVDAVSRCTESAVSASALRS
jgi:rare lipoprotein A